MVARKKRLPRTRYSREEITEIFSRFREYRPEPKGELEHVNPFTLVVAVALSAQATDAGVNRATRDLFKVADTPEKMVALGEEKVRDYIKTIGLYRNKAKNVIALSQKLIENFDSVVPQTREDLVTLPGVGRKTANVVLGTAFGIASGVVVDTHVGRISRRLGMTVETDLPGNPNAKNASLPTSANQRKRPATYLLPSSRSLIRSFPLPLKSPRFSNLSPCAYAPSMRMQRQE